MNFRQTIRAGLAGLVLAGALCTNAGENAQSYKTDDFRKDSDKVLLARMLFGEARNCTREEKIAIGYTALNRANDNKKWNGTTVKGAILAPMQYSCFNSNDPNRNKMMDPMRYDAKSFNECLYVAGQILEGKVSDKVKATHYHTLSINPKWAKSDSMIPKGKIDKHVFYKEK